MIWYQLLHYLLYFHEILCRRCSQKLPNIRKFRENHLEFLPVHSTFLDRGFSSDLGGGVIREDAHEKAWNMMSFVKIGAVNSTYLEAWKSFYSHFHEGLCHFGEIRCNRCAVERLRVSLTPAQAMPLFPYMIFKLLPHTRQHVDACVARTWISYRCVPCHPWCTHRTFLVVKKNFFSFPVAVNNSIKVGPLVFLL